MKWMGKLVFLMVGVLVGTLWGYATFAQGIEPNPDSAFLEQVFKLISEFGGMEWMAKIGGVIAVLISSMKVSILRPMWDKLGDFKFWLAPLFGLAVGVLSLGSGLTLASAFAYITAGLGAVFLHEILDLVKKIPGIGPLWLSVIDMLKLLFRAPVALPAFLAIAMLGLTGCPKNTDVACEAAKIIAKPVAAGLGSLAACKNPGALEPWLIEKIKAIKPDLCEVKPSVKSIVGEIICPALIDGVISGGISLLPAAAECSGGSLADDAKESLLKFCKDSI